MICMMELNCQSIKYSKANVGKDVLFLLFSAILQQDHRLLGWGALKINPSCKDDSNWAS